MSSTASPVMRWTPAEAWLMVELARRSLVATLDDGTVVRSALSGEPGRFHVEVEDGGEDVVLALRFDADHATLALDPAPVSGHHWRAMWTLELVSGGHAVGMLGADGPPIEIRSARGGVRAQLLVQRRAIVRPLDGIDEVIPIVDVSFHRYTRQSTAEDGAVAVALFARPIGIEITPLAPYALPTEAEPAPWWEIDLERAAYIAWVRIDLATLPAGARIVCRAFGFSTPTGAPPPDCTIDVDYGHAGERAWITAEPRVVARFIRVEVIAAAGETVSLAVTAAEILGADLHSDTLLATMRRAFVLHRDRTLYETREGEGMPYHPHLRYAEVWDRAMALARGLATRLEVPPGPRPVLGVLMTNRVEWIFVELAAIARGYVVVGLSPDDPDDRIALILARSRVIAVIAETATADRIERLAPALRLVVGLDDEPTRATGRRIGFTALVDDGDDADPPEAAACSGDDPFAVLFTSGSTGTPKGAMRSYAAFFAVIASYEIGHCSRHLSFQPLSHLSERMYLPALLFFGATLAFSRGGAHLLDELRAFEPTSVGSVPRLYEVLHASYTRRLRAALAAEPETPRAVLEKRCLAEARATFGTRLVAISVGSAPVSAEVYAFMKRCFADVWVSEGYGSTEVGSIAFDGKIVKDVAVKLVPPPETPPPAFGASERGEIWVKTPHAITGYLADDGSTTSPLDADGYFATGDLGERDADGLVRVIGRLRNTVKLAQGEFVSAERIEAALGSAPLVDRIYVHVESGAPGVAALVVPCELGTVSLVARLAAHGRAAGLAAYEIPRAVLIETVPFTVESGLLTASGKLARGALAARYGAELSRLAAGAAVDDGETVPIADEDLLARVLRAARLVIGRDVDPREPLGSGVGVDSLAAAEILAAISDDLGRDVPLAWWFEARTLEDLASRLGRFAGGGDGITTELAAADRALAGAFTPARAARPIARVLLTGATGFLGAHLVEALLARGIGVTCLVRAPDDAAARVRLVEALARHDVPVVLDDRVRAVAGDLAADGLGLADPRIGPSVDAIVHAGATVSWLASYHALRGPNVRGTHALLELAAAHGLAMHHVSTISTAPIGGDESTRLTEAAALASTPYGLSKWIAEDLALRARAAGLPVAIYRPAMIAGHSSRGTGNADDFVNRYLVGCADLGRYVDRADGILDMTPVDFVATAIAALVVGAPHANATYHLVNVDQSMSFAALGRSLVAAGLPLTPATYPEFRAALHDHRTTCLHALAAFFPAQFSLGMGPWPCVQTLVTLAELGVTRPQIDDAIIAAYVAALRRRGLRFELDR